ncbi:hypothetical protein [Bacillus aerolatus]|uniref:hypothetical protein n=1 Tax=Bacillus aerolatus TaxID=2653354 RepID=UPI0017841B58|nr:hypothetical protein [Bacillus aerolatus]
MKIVILLHSIIPRRTYFHGYCAQIEYGDAEIQVIYSQNPAVGAESCDSRA